MSPFTPGPWRAIGLNIYAPSESSRIASVRKPEDAPLVKSAPALLSALRASAPYFRDGGLCWCSSYTGESSGPHEPGCAEARGVLAEITGALS